MKTKILTHYIDTILESGHKPKSIYKFCKDLEIEESEFYKYYTSFKHVESSFWKEITSQTIATIKDSEQPQNNSTSHNLLTFYFTLFENLTLNRSYVLYTLEVDNVKLLLNKELRKGVFPHLKHIAMDIETIAHKLSEDIGNKLSEEGLWIQFVSILKYWMNDESPSFECTDAFIEKSVKASMELNQHIPTDSLLDYGKFVFKEFKKFL